MSKITAHEQLSSTAIGLYTKNTLFIRMSSEADLNPGDGIEPFPGALPAHVHEFVHYLHNISTTSGIRVIMLTHVMVFMAAQYLIKVGDGVGQSGKSSIQGDDFKFFIDNISYLYGDHNDIQDDGRIRSDGWSFSDLKSYRADCFPEFFSYKINMFGNFSGVRINKSLRIGFNFITEGVAYEVEREMSRELEQDLIQIERLTPKFPYLAYEPLVNYLVGRKTTPLERIRIGNAALMHISPSMGFVDACVALRKSEYLFDGLFKKYIDGFADYIKKEFHPMLVHLMDFYKNTDRLSKSYKNYMSLIVETSRKRLANQFLEESFLGQGVNYKNFTKKASSVAEFCIMQEKSNGSAGLVMHGHSQGLASVPEEDTTWFYVLCAAIHFVQLHLTMSGEVMKTAQLEPKMCLFSGACQVELNEGNPSVCKTRPWNFERKVDVDKQGVCWYIAGIKSITPEPIVRS